MAPTVPPRINSVLPAAEREAISTLIRRSASASSAFSSLSGASSTENFLQAKTDSLEADIAANNHIRDAFDEARRQRVIAEDEYKEAIGKTDMELAAAERELVVIRRQKKIILEDMDEAMPKHETIGEAYADTITSRIMAATGHQKRSSQQKNGRSSDQKAFRQDVFKYYGAKRETDDGSIKKFCHLTGWTGGELVKCAHIVPKSLDSDELAYLFGVRETMLSEPRNGLVLNRTIEGAMDNGEIVFVPDKPAPGVDIVWRCVVINKSKGPEEVTDNTRFRDIDGKELMFLNSNRPARRYLYLRYVITCIHQKRIGNSDMLEQALRRTDVRGYIWATPGPYLRKSMLISLAREVSDRFLPEAFYDTSTFADADGCPGRSAEAEDDLAMGLDVMVRDAFEEARDTRRADGDSDSDTDDDEGDV